jgi:hypothetical protein
VIFIKATQNWEVDTFASFFMMLYLGTMRQEGEDKLQWVPSKRELFGVKFFYRVMGCHDDFHFPWKSLWMAKVSLRIAFFVWSAALEKIFTMDNLWKRYVIVVDRCCM